MAENTQWIAEQGRKTGCQRIFVAGHNSHVARWGSYDSMGKLLAEKMGGGYYVIGTDFYKTCCNMPALADAPTRFFSPMTRWPRRQKRRGWRSAGWTSQRLPKAQNWRSSSRSTSIWALSARVMLGICDFCPQAIGYSSPPRSCTTG